MSPELLPCPFCGGEAAIGTVHWTPSTYKDCMPDLNRTDGYFGQCISCNTEHRGLGVGYATREHAVEKWNARRPTPSPLAAAPDLLEELEAEKTARLSAEYALESWLETHKDFVAAWKSSAPPFPSPAAPLEVLRKAEEVLSDMEEGFREAGVVDISDETYQHIVEALNACRALSPSSTAPSVMTLEQIFERHAGICPTCDHDFTNPPSEGKEKGPGAKVYLFSAVNSYDDAGWEVLGVMSDKAKADAKLEELRAMEKEDEYYIVSYREVPLGEIEIPMGYSEGQAPGEKGKEDRK